MKSKYVLIIAAILVAGGAALYAIFYFTNKESFSMYTDTGYNVSGVWFSDQLDQDTLTLSQTASYDSASWIANGMYTVKGSQIILTDTYGTVYELTVSESNSVYMLTYQENEMVHHYYRTQQEITDSLEGEEPIDEQMTALYRSAVKQILAASTWTQDASGESLQFQDEELRYQVNGTEKTYLYDIVDVFAQDGVYYAKLSFDGSQPVELTIAENETSYELSSSFFGPLTFKASNNVSFTQ